jgi:AsmA protein
MTDEQLKPTKRSRRIWWILTAVVALLLLVLLPPFLNINHYRHRIAASIGGALGRPVRMDSVGFRILPTPGFTIENFVVGENPAFGDEPFLRANTVTATLHVSSLWRGHLEFATIALDEPSVNLVRNATGQWNFESILLPASLLPGSQTGTKLLTAPTDQPHPGGLPRFPYIEATQARVNFKMGVEKKPFSLTDAKLALWLSQPETWHIRMEARPLRTDMNATDTGLVQAEGTFQRAATLDAIPLKISATWEKAQLGDVSHMLMGQNAGWRGNLDAETTITGLFGNAQIDAKLHLDEVRRAEFVPERSLTLDAACTANATSNLHAFSAIHCTLPLGDGSLTMEGNLSDIRQGAHPTLKIAAQQVPASQLLELARHATNRIDPALTADGKIDGLYTYGPIAASSNPKAYWQGSVAMPAMTLNVPGIPGSLTIANLHLHTPDTIPGKKHRTMLTGAVLDPVTLALGAAAPATLDGILHHNNYALHLHGSVMESQLLALAKAVPQFGDGLEDVLPPLADDTSQPIFVDATTHRTWSGMGMYAGGSQLSSSEIWTSAAQHKPHRR